MDIDIKELIKTATENLNLKDFKGDVVAVKVVENEFGTIEEGSIGVQNVYYGADGKKVVDKDAINPSAEESFIEDDDVANRDTIIPADCTAALGKVLVPTFTIDSIVLNSMQQLIKASAQINLLSNSEVAMLMAIGMEVNAVRPGCNCPDFVRALIGMGVIAYVDKNAIDKMAGGMNKKLYGYTKGATKYSALPANHLRWNSNDLPIGMRIYEAIKSQG